MKALRFLDALSGSGRLELYDRRHNLCVISSDTTANDEGADARLLRFLEDLDLVAQWSGMKFTLPQAVSAEEVVDVARAAALVRKQEVPVRLDNFTLEVDEQGLARLREGGQLAFTQDYGVQVLGREVPLGIGFASVPRYEMCEPPEYLPSGGYRVRLQPPTEAEKSLTIKLSRHPRRKPRGKAQSRRSPSPKTGSRKGKRKKH